MEGGYFPSLSLHLRFIIILSVSFRFPPPAGSLGRDPPSKRREKEKKRFNCGSELYRTALIQDDMTSLPVIQGKRA